MCIRIGYMGFVSDTKTLMRNSTVKLNQDTRVHHAVYDVVSVSRHAGHYVVDDCLAPLHQPGDNVASVRPHAPSPGPSGPTRVTRYDPISIWEINGHPGNRYGI
jgi:hypothetical protein